MTLNLARTGLRKALFFVPLAAAALLGSGSVGHAQTSIINCNLDPAALVKSAAAPQTTFVVLALQNTVLIEGTCVGNAVINQPISYGLVLQQHSLGGHVQGSLTIGVPNVTINNLLIDGTGASGAAIQLTGFANNTTLNDVTIQNSPGHGIAIGAGSMNLNGGLITANANCGLYVFNNGMAWLNNDSGAVPIEIRGNGTGPAGSTQCGVDVEDGASMAITSAYIHDNLGGSALRIFMAMADVSGGTFQSPASVTYPTIAIERGSLGLRGATVTGTGQSNAIFASPGSTIKMQNSTVSQSDTKDATILVADGSVLLSVGGNTITNSAAGGALTVANASTFHQRNEASMGIPLVADTFTGTGGVQVQSNIELGTGGTTPSTWNGSITVQQNSSFRMDGGITITGLVQISQGSNAFFNKAATGTNVVDGGVTCVASAGSAVASHVAGPANVVLANGTSAVTTGNSAPDCPSF